MDRFAWYGKPFPDIHFKYVLGGLGNLRLLKRFVLRLRTQDYQSCELFFLSQGQIPHMLRVRMGSVEDDRG
jgi:hypothetical protein